MIPVKEYKIASGDSESELLVDIEKALAVGWQPQGGISVYAVPTWNNHNESDGYEVKYFQAMVR